VAALVAFTLSDPDLRAVLARAGAYVERYQEAFSVLVAEERYRQEVADRSGAPARETRELVSEFALVRVAGVGAGGQEGPRFLAFRDVVAVDGRPVPDRGARLAQLFRHQAEDALAQASAIARESARYNLGSILRTVNVPTLALEFFEPRRQPRARYRHVRDDRTGGLPVWVVAFEERARPTLIRTPEGRDVVAKGAAWIDPATGRIVRTELEPAGPRGLVSHLVVVYAPDARAGLWVPVEMQETYARANEVVRGEAIYSNYRRFDVDVRIKPRG